MELAEAMALTRGNDHNDYFNNPFMYLIWLAFFGGGFGGFGWGGRDAGLAAAASAEQVRQVNDTQTILAKMDNLGMGINGVNTGVLQTGANLQNALFQTGAGLGDKMVSGFNDIGMNMVNGFNNVVNGVNENRYAAQQCCCETQKSILETQYKNAENTGAIITNETANTQKILDKLCQMESSAKDNTIAQLRQDLQAAQLTLGNANQTANIVNALRPTPIPAYITCSPYASNGCGCGV